MNYFRKRRERQAKSNSGIYCPAANRPKFNMKLKKKLTMRFNMITEV